LKVRPIIECTDPSAALLVLRKTDGEAGYPEPRTRNPDEEYQAPRQVLQQLSHEQRSRGWQAITREAMAMARESPGRYGDGRCTALFAEIADFDCFAAHARLARQEQ
jgi:hypothetical protein